ncbi:MAG: hypothetical protein HC837_01905 [Chloroflexaceae bacterium]|nr:hypothetical protein [Chloroflexaceae bacterium]
MNNSNRYGTGNRSDILIGGFRIKSTYLYLAAAVAVVITVLLMLSLAMNVLTAGLMPHVALAAGIILLWANIREAKRQRTSLANSLIGGSLVTGWLAVVLFPLLWVIALPLLVVATPLALGHDATYRAYLDAAHTTAERFRRTIIRTR